MRGPNAGAAMPRWILLAVAMLLMGSHVCLLPSHHHDASAGSHAGEVVHAASCEGVRSAPTACPIIAGGIQVALPHFTAVAAEWGGARRPKVSLKSPPLFLLHSALLI
jgi:hypothetical protein